MYYWLQGFVQSLAEKNFGEHTELVMRDPCLFGDYRNTLTEDPRLYEDVVDYDASKAIFEEVTNTPIL